MTRLPQVGVLEEGDSAKSLDNGSLTSGPAQELTLFVPNHGTSVGHFLTQDW